MELFAWMSRDEPCFVLFSIPLRGVKIILPMIRNFRLLRYALLQQKCGVSCACGWYRQQSILERESSGLAFAPVDRSLTLSSFYKVTEKKTKIFLTLFLNCYVVISGFFCWPANRDNSEQNHFSCSLGVTWNVQFSALEPLSNPHNC